MNRQTKAEKVVIAIDDEMDEGIGEGGSGKRRNSPVIPPLERLENIMYEGMNINCHINVELVDGEFLRVKDIIRDTRTLEIFLRGWIFRRTREMNGLLERKTNELCWILHIDEDDKRESYVQGMESIPITHVRKRRLIRMTNRPYPELSWRQDGIENQEVILSDRVLVCRYKYMCVYADANARKQNKWCEKALLRLQKPECDKSVSMEDETLRYSWRGETLKGGSWKDLVAGQRERHWCHQNPQPSHNTSMFPRFRPSKERRASLQPHVEGLQKLQPLDSARDDGTVLRDSSLEIMERAPESSNNLASLHQPVIKSRFGITRSRGSTDFSTDDYHLGSSTSRRKRSKGSDGSLSFHFRRDSSEVLEIPPPTALLSRLRGQQKEEIGQCNSSRLSDIAGAKRSISQVQRSQHHPRKRINTGLFNPATDHSRGSPLLIDESSESTKPSPQPSQPRYTFGDCFCGAGGTSRGAIGAGLRINWGFDFNLMACKSFKLNFPAARVYNVWAHDFASLPDQDQDYKVDICHLSPPCQYFSDAHTRAGRDDEMNTATLFSVSKLLEKARPRVVTLEQTSGLLRRHYPFFNALVLMFTERGFSIRWRLLQCADYGLPQHRLRLFMIASCPGEPLPSFPPPTHSANPNSLEETGLKPWTTINKAISHIPPNWPNHDITAAKPHHTPAQDGNQLARCMTTSGAGMIHPSGRRALTLREFANLQGFPLDHMFSDVAVKKQIGNAVPPVVARAILEEVKRGLMKADGLIG